MNFLTTGDIAEKLDVDRDMVSYAIRKAKVAPVGRAGHVRLFPDSAVAIVEQFLSELRPRTRRRDPRQELG